MYRQCCIIYPTCKCMATCSFFKANVRGSMQGSTGLQSNYIATKFTMNGATRLWCLLCKVRSSVSGNLNMALRIKKITLTSAFRFSHTTASLSSAQNVKKFEEIPVAPGENFNTKNSLSQLFQVPKCHHPFQEVDCPSLDTPTYCKKSLMVSKNHGRTSWK